MQRRFHWYLTIAVLAFIAADATAQMSRRGGGGSAREGRDTREPQKREPALSTEPLAALERELPSLNVDLLLTADQLTLWRAFERDVRDVAEMDRARRRHVASLREGAEGPATALLVIASLAEDERMKNDAMADMKRHLEALYGKLDDRQKRTLDQRVVMSQKEPLGP